MKKQVCIEQQFLKDVADHTMTIHADYGMVRMITFRKPNTVNLMFSLVTWPGSLCISGGMGCYVFSRLADMFQFFRADRADRKEGATGLFINLGYWAEKLDAVDKYNKVKEYDYEIFKQIIQERINEAATTKAQRDAVAQLVESLDGEPIEEVHIRVRDFEEFEFSDFWEHDLTEYTDHFIWCCYAIAWGIQQYDNSEVVERMETYEDI